ncbi:hypothetical protein Osc7112_1881 [Oscillatoria nigro-viridis PCC 7112]|uniref:Uncharacterized protein n=1 Tax=Phormidium nigroviride PCC 7112 TaxID=179408 RepID=K9VGH9_9CYAN|nr:hypothetical protein [Oscillatoria nigro-viridis]AFZ06365.1 hypothetical protein Osc7112_1881 [Oscillatoria nigro-viridis PCC 7112]
MLRKAFIGLISFALLTIITLSSLTSQVSAMPTCSNETLKGLYVHTSSGFRGTAAPFIPLATLRTAEIQNGKVKGRGTLSLGGDVKNYRVEGTYEVSSDCTVIFSHSAISDDGSISQASKHFGIIVDRGKKVYYIQQTPGINETGIYEKIS